MSVVAWTRLAVIAGAVGLVELLCRTGVIKPFTMIAPSAMAAALVRLLQKPDVLADLAFTSTNILIAMVLSIGLGFVAGILLHRFTRVRRVTAPILAASYAVPTFVFYPLMIGLFGLGRWSLIAIGLLLGIVGMLVNTLDGFDRIPRVYTKTAAMLRMSPPATTMLVNLPAAAPHLVTGVKLAITFSITGVIAGEFDHRRRRHRPSHRDRLQQPRQPDDVRLAAAAVAGHDDRQRLDPRVGAAHPPHLGPRVTAARRFVPWIDGAAFAALVLITWQLLFLRVGDSGFASPLETLARLVQMFGTPVFWSNVAATGIAYLWACLFAIGGGLAIGLALGLWRFAGDVFGPIVNALATLPKITLYPVILLFFGLGLWAKVAFGTIHGIFPIIILTVNGVRTIKPVVRKTARVMRLGRSKRCARYCCRRRCPKSSRACASAWR